MRRLFLIWMGVLLMCLPFIQLKAQGIPFLRNYSAEEYGAHNRNSDIVTDENGIVYVANFEGVIYYDKSSFRILRTPGFMRITSLYKDSKGVIWAGGYRFFGKIEVADNGEPRLQSLAKKGSLRGEVLEIWEAGNRILFAMSDSTVYDLKDNTLKKNAMAFRTPGNVLGSRIDKKLEIANGPIVSVIDGKGLLLDYPDGHQVSVTEHNGLCSNNINSIDYDGHGILWGATDNGFFAIAVPSAYSQFSVSEGLRGEVLCISKFNNSLYVGTVSGLFRKNGMRFESVSPINHACWQLAEQNGRLLAATSKGVFSIESTGSVSQLTENSALSILTNSDSFYTGEIDGLYYNSPISGHKKICKQENVIRILRDKDDHVWIQSLDGQILHRTSTQVDFTPVEDADSILEAATLIKGSNEEAIIVSALDTEPFPYPAFSYTDEQDNVWLTDNTGRQLYAWKRGKILADMSVLLSPLAERNIRAMLHDDQILWLGEEKCLTLVDCSKTDSHFINNSRLCLRSVMLRGDSVLWGGFGTMPKSLPALSSNERHLIFCYALDYEPLVGATYYRYRLDDGQWDTWRTVGSAEFNNIGYGSHTLEIQARNTLGVESEILSIDFQINPPFFLHPLMILVYILLIIYIIYRIVRYRLSKLELAKVKLEKVVQERTAEIVKQKDEIEEKSVNLEKALNELEVTQHELVRQEKMATVGKLTQGLIDRILNPLNYINNFSKLSEGLVRDVEDNIEDEKDHFNQENYEDTIDVLGMLRVNLQKVSEHGQHTTRTLKAMEEMLKDRSGGIVSMNLSPVIQQDVQMLQKYFAEQIHQCHIKVNVSCPKEEIIINGNADQLSKTFMSILGNSVYALEKKLQRDKFEPTIDISVITEAQNVMITIRDNGIGIEESIINKVFDPFFTTKTTAEASGVGLYLSREIIQNHRGDISVKSVKNEFTEFIIKLPIQKS